MMNITATARQIGEDAIKFNDPNLINTILDKQNAVTLDQVNAGAKTYLVRDGRTVVTTMPAQNGHLSSTAAR